MLFEVLFWTGCRIGEALALTGADVDKKNGCIHISKTYHRSNSADIVTTPKTETAVRDIDVPEFLMKELEQYMDSLYVLVEMVRI